MRNKKYLHILAVIMMLTAICCLPMVFACEHENTEVKTVLAATCTESGQEDVFCVDCNDVVEKREVNATGHFFDDYTIKIEASPNKNGLEAHTCLECGFVEEREYICPHASMTAFITKFPTCTESGFEDVICDACGTVTTTYPVSPNGHSVENYNITVKPTPNQNGVQTGTCSVCDEVVESEYICPHDISCAVMAEEPTCKKTGKENVICEFCETIIETNTVNIVDCNYGDWIEINPATPFESGERYHECIYCEKRVTESYCISMPSENSIYIPGTGICHNFAVSSFTQGAVDSNDIVYAYAYDFGMGANDPFVLGHNTGTMKNLDKTRVGQYIYICKDGIIETYEVIVSEFGMMTADEMDIIGQTSRCSMWRNLGNKTLHMYTCVKGVANGRWLVLARLVV